MKIVSLLFKRLNKDKMKVVILSRVSTHTQDNQRQINELTEFSKNRNWELVKVFQEKISGNTKNEDRPVLMEMISFIQRNERYHLH